MTYDLQHGDRHAKGGSDPIPGLATGGFPWCFMSRRSGFTIDHSGGVNNLDLSTGDFYTNAADTYATFTYTGTGGSSTGGIKILLPGTYKMTVAAPWDTIEAAASGQVYYSQISVGSGGTMSAGWLGGRICVHGNDTFNAPVGFNANQPQVFWQQYLNIPGDGMSIDGFTGNNATPVELEFWALQQTATVNGTLSYVQILIEQTAPEFYKNVFTVDAQ